MIFNKKFFYRLHLITLDNFLFLKIINKIRFKKELDYNEYIN